jgi:hypothetical protein
MEGLEYLDPIFNSCFMILNTCELGFCLWQIKRLQGELQNPCTGRFSD